MRFFIFMIIVFGVFLLAIGQGRDESVGSLVDKFVPDSLPGANRTAQVASPQESGFADAAEETPAIVESITQANEPSATESSKQDAPKSEGLPATAVLTRGEDYTRQQLEKYSQGIPASSRGVAPSATPNHRETMQDINALNRDALSTLSRVDSILHSNKRGEK